MGIHVMSPPETDTTPNRRSTAPPATTPLPLPTRRIRSPLKGRITPSFGVPPPPPRAPPPPPVPVAVVNAIHRLSREKTGPLAVVGARPVTGRCVFVAREATQIWPPRVKAMNFLSFESVKFAASLSGPYRVGRGGFAVGLTV